MIFAPVFKLAEAVLELLIPLVMAGIIDQGIAKGNVHYIVTHGALMIALGAIGLACGLICQYFSAVCAQGFGRSLRRSLFRHVLRLSEAEAGTLGADALITRLTNDVNQVQTGLNMFLRLAVRAPFLAIGSIVMAFVISPRIGLVFLASTPLIILVLAVIMRRTVPLYGHMQTQQDSIARLAGENLAGARVIRAFSRQKTEIADFNAAGNALAAATVQAGKISALLNPITTVIVNLAIVAIVWVGGKFAQQGILAQGQIIALVNYMTQTLLALIVLANLIVIFTKAIASAKRVTALFDVTSSLSETQKSAQPQPNAPRIAFENVSFTYPGGAEPALENLSFTLQKGQTMGIIGGTGCGKTTLIQLLQRTYDATQGHVRIDGVDVRDFTFSALHEKISIVPQTAMLFSGTVRSNLQMGSPDATDEDLWRALAAAQADEMVRGKEGGLDAAIEEGGKNFSGGQKQRLTIARALVRKPQILILDDASSALDYATDAALRKTLRAEFSGATVLLISQRAAALKDADVIAVMDDGKIVGFAPHETLLQTSAVYREICITQGLVKEGAAV